MLDVQDTIVVDPFFHECPKALGMTMKELFAGMLQSAWSFNPSHPALKLCRAQ